MQEVYICEMCRTILDVRLIFSWNLPVLLFFVFSGTLDELVNVYDTYTYRY